MSEPFGEVTLKDYYTVDEHGDLKYIPERVVDPVICVRSGQEGPGNLSEGDAVYVAYGEHHESDGEAVGCAKSFLKETLDFGWRSRENCDGAARVWVDSSSYFFETREQCQETLAYRMDDTALEFGDNDTNDYESWTRTFVWYRSYEESEVQSLFCKRHPPIDGEGDEDGGLIQQPFPLEGPWPSAVFTDSPGAPSGGSLTGNTFGRGRLRPPACRGGECPR